MSSQHEYLCQSNDKNIYSSIFKVLNGLSSQKKIQNVSNHFDQSIIINPFSLSDEKRISYSYLAKKQRRSLKGSFQKKSYKKSWTVDEYRRFTIIFLMKTLLQISFCRELIEFFSSRTRQQIHSHYLRLKHFYNQFQKLFFSYFTSYKELTPPLRNKKKALKKESMTFEFLESLFLQLQFDLNNEEFAMYLTRHGFDNSVVYDKLFNHSVLSPAHYISNKPLFELTNTIDPKDFGIEDNDTIKFTFSEKKHSRKKMNANSDIVTDDILENKNIIAELETKFILNVEKFQKNKYIVIDEDFLLEFANENFQLQRSLNNSNISINEI